MMMHRSVCILLSVLALFTRSGALAQEAPPIELPITEVFGELTFDMPSGCVPEPGATVELTMTKLRVAPELPTKIWRDAPPSDGIVRVEKGSGYKLPFTATGTKVTPTDRVEISAKVRLIQKSSASLRMAEGKSGTVSLRNAKMGRIHLEQVPIRLALNTDPIKPGSLAVLRIFVKAPKGVALDYKETAKVSLLDATTKAELAIATEVKNAILDGDPYLRCTFPSNAFTPDQKLAAVVTVTEAAATPGAKVKVLDGKIQSIIAPATGKDLGIERVSIR